MTSQTPRPEPGRNEPGYRGALPTREDRLARTWVLTVIAIFVLIFVLAVARHPVALHPGTDDHPAAIHAGLQLGGAVGIGSDVRLSVGIGIGLGI